MNANPNYPNQANLAFVEELYVQYLNQPDSVSPEWRAYFDVLGNGRAQGNGPGSPARPATGPSFKARSIFNPAGSGFPLHSRKPESASRMSHMTGLQDRVDQCIRAFRNRGHMIAQIDPLGLPRPCPPELQLDYYGFSEEDLDRVFSCETIHCGHGQMSLGAIVQRLQNTYCRYIGVQYMHIDDIALRRWLRDRMEGTENRLDISRDEQLRILARLTDAVTFEEFIRKKFVGAKSFSLEGCESLIPLLDLAIEKAGDQGIKEIVLGMAHRGRLNVLANIMGKSPRQIFREFADKDPELYRGRGDVKYHLGHSTDWQTVSGNKVHLSLCFNPSHLEFVNPVALGRVRAKQDRGKDTQRNKVMGILIHGDSGFIGQGMVQETLNMSQLEGYSTGGTLHIIVNNQIGFTTGPEDYRSCNYTTDVAKMLQAPIFHVNGEDPEAVAQVVKVSLEFRETFQRDVFIDMYGYRRLGHNEGDEPSFTQPVLYAAIAKRKSVREGYVEHLLSLKGVDREEADTILDSRRELLEKELSESQSTTFVHHSDIRPGYWTGHMGGPDADCPEVKTGAEPGQLAGWLEKLTHLPDDFHPHPKIERLLQIRREMAGGSRPLDWSAAEALAFASTACQGFRVRLSGQDSERGTFSQRHAVLHDYEDRHCHCPLQHLSPDQANVEIINSPLSESGVLGFDYGYSLDLPNGLVLWEAQFGDFCNSAQVIIDQFIASAEDKWNRLSGVTLLLPHGFEGQGPEHSSARLERFLNLAAEDNMQVVSPSTPAQYFHVLRRQVLRKWRKPLIVMTPKSLLRHPKVVSSLADLEQGQFQRVIPDGEDFKGSQIKRVLLCTGKIYYELAQHREDQGRQDVAILRLEQLYPLKLELIQQALGAFAPETPVYHVQEEPENMGSWRYIFFNFGFRLFNRHPLTGIHRRASASPATGSANSHRLEQRALLKRAFQ